MKKIGSLWRILIVLTLYTTMGLSQASTTPAPTSDTIEFAKQAGTIAGIAQACGHDTTLLHQRAAEVIQTLSNTDTEQKLAINLYYKTSQLAQHAQQKTHAVVCHNALMELQKLPLLQNDYKKTVLEKLK